VTNRLSAEQSPYLLQHATNPVDWYPWGDEAFAKAAAEQKPIFLSIGYSTCHWCHVMAHESFENPDVAAVLNTQFVPVKVDREERPDVDRVYMAFVQSTTGSGGWPMSVWLTPELTPFYGGTYFPPTSRWGRPGFVDILTEISRVWQSDAAGVRASGNEILRRLGEREASSSTMTLPGREGLERTADSFRQAFDTRFRGFGTAPKFPRPSELLFLLRESYRTKRLDLRHMAVQTLRAMALGGMRDHIGGGFHRYSVDREWRVPHFEKMLYDQAQLVTACIEAAQASGDAFFVQVADDTLRYVMREMTDEAGGFFSAEDADSVPVEQVDTPGAHATEGAFYLWKADEIDALLGADAELVRRHFGIEPGGNAPHDPQQEFTGRNILYVAVDARTLSAAIGRPLPDIEAALHRARVAMFEARLSRPRPHLDDKVLTAWNGLMIGAFARMARFVSGGTRVEAGPGAPFLQAARRAATFLREQLWRPESGTLLRRYRRGQADVEAYAEDYAFLVHGLLELFVTDPDPDWLEWAVTLQDRQDALFWDDVDGGWFSTTGRDPRVLLRMKETYDGAEPSATSVSAWNLLTLTRLIHRPEWEDRLERSWRLFGTALERVGRAVPMMAAAFSTWFAGPVQVIVVGAGRESGDIERTLATRYLPNVLSIVFTPEQQKAVSSVLPLVSEMRNEGDTAMAYVCRHFTCQPPVTTAEEVLQHVESSPLASGARPMDSGSRLQASDASGLLAEST